MEKETFHDFYLSLKRGDVFLSMDFINVFISYGFKDGEEDPTLTVIRMLMNDKSYVERTRLHIDLWNEPKADELRRI